MEKEKLNTLIEQLKRDKEYAIESAAELITGDMRESIGELSVADNHPADIGTAVYDRSRDVAIRDRLKHRAHAIDNALQRAEKGLYNICENCGTEIPYERLEALPYTTVCTECSRKEEREEQHSLHREPVENDILATPFARTFNDGTDRTGFDGEDAWQAVARYGTSDSPQDLGTNRDVHDPNEYYEDADEIIGAVEAIETMEVEDDPEVDTSIYYHKKHGKA